jgi:hypothetical protein
MTPCATCGTPTRARPAGRRRVSPAPRGVRMGAEDARQRAIAQPQGRRRKCGGPEAAARHEASRRVGPRARRTVPQAGGGAGETQEDRERWEKITQGPAPGRGRRLRAAAPLPGAEDHAAAVGRAPGARRPEPGWLATLAEQRKGSRRSSGSGRTSGCRRRSDYQDQGEAWPLWKTQKEAVLQPPPAPIPPAREMERLAGLEAGG